MTQSSRGVNQKPTCLNDNPRETWCRCASALNPTSCLKASKSSQTCQTKHELNHFDFSLWRSCNRKPCHFAILYRKTLACWENNQLPVREGDTLILIFSLPILHHYHIHQNAPCSFTGIPIQLWTITAKVLKRCTLHMFSWYMCIQNKYRISSADKMPFF